MLSHVRLSATPWTVACQALLFVGFSRPEYWSGLPFPPPGDLPNPRKEPTSPALVGRFFSTSTTWEALMVISVQFSSVAQSCPTLCDPRDCSPPGSSVRGILQARILEWVAMPSSGGIFPIRGSNLVLPHCRQILYCLSHQGSPRLLEWVAYPFSRGSS